MKYYDPRADILFKKIFGRNEDLTISFLNAMLPLEGDGLDAGLAKGRAEGRADAMREMARNLKSLGKITNEEIATATGLNLEEVSQI